MKTPDTKKSASAQPKAPSKPAPTVSAMPDDKRYMAEDDLRTLSRAEEIRRDASRMAEAVKCRDAKMRDMAAIKVEVSKPMRVK